VDRLLKSCARLHMNHVTATTPSALRKWASFKVFRTEINSRFASHTCQPILIAKAGVWWRYCCANGGHSFRSVPIEIWNPESILTPVAGLLLKRLGFEKIFKTQGIFKIKEHFQVMLEWFKYSRHMGWTHSGSKKRRKFQKSRDFLGAISGHFTFHGSFSKRSVQI